MIHERLHSDMTVMCLHFHMDWCIIHPIDGVVKVVFSDVDLYLQHGQHTRCFPLVAFLKLIDAYLSTPSAFSIFPPASIVS